MLPAELEAKYGQSGGYGNYLDWIGAGAKHLSWSQTAEQAAKAAGLSQHQDWFTQGAYKDASHDWGEGYHVDPNSGAALGSIYNPNWTNFITNWNAQHADETHDVNTAPQVGSAPWLAGNAAPSPWAVDDTPGPPQGYNLGNDIAPPFSGAADPMTASRAAQKEAELRRLLAQALGPKIAGQKSVVNPFAAGRAFGHG